MSGEKRAYRMDVSDYYFRLTTECVRLHSNSAFKYSRLEDVIEKQSGSIKNISSMYKPRHLKEHLRLIPSEGDVVIEITILNSSVKHIDDALHEIGMLLDTSMTFVEMISILLFDFMVEQNRTEVLTKLGLSAEEAHTYKSIAKRSLSNVVPFKGPS